jgi:hypothetical protein
MAIYQLNLTVPQIRGGYPLIGNLSYEWHDGYAPAVLYGGDQILFKFDDGPLTLNFAVIRFTPKVNAMSANPVTGAAGGNFPILDITDGELTIREDFATSFPPNQLMSWCYAIYATFTDKDKQQYQYQLPDPEMVIVTGNPPPNAKAY